MRVVEIMHIASLYSENTRVISS